MTRPRRRPATRFGVVGLGVVGATAALLAGCSLVLDFSAPGVDAGPADAATDAAADAGPDPCTLLEPNETLDAPLVLAAGVHPAALCAGDEDYYRITLAADQRLVLSLTFDNRGGDGDLDLRVTDTTGAELSSSATALDEERITCPSVTCDQLPAGDIVVQVRRALPSVTNPYQLTVEITSP